MWAWKALPVMHIYIYTRTSRFYNERGSRTNHIRSSIPPLYQLWPSIQYFIAVLTGLLISTPIFSRRQCFVTAVVFQTQNTRLCSHLGATGNANISSTANLNSLTRGKNSHAGRSIHELILHPDNTAHFWCKTVRILAVSYGWTEAVFTPQNKSQAKYIFFLHPAVKL